MDNNSFMELKSKVAALPLLQDRLKSLNSRVYQAEADVKSLLKKYQEEALDVDAMQKDSLSNTILKLVRRYEGKVNKETQEMLSAKLEYDKAADRVKQLTSERAELTSKIGELTADKKAFDEEYKKRVDTISSQVSSEVFSKYSELEDQQATLTKQLVETDEALFAAKRVIASAEIAVKHLEKADGWATYDIWGGGSIITHMAKYEYIDDAKSQLNGLSSLIRDFETELRDVNMYEVSGFTGIDSTTRAVDFWFDNIFTDLKVRDKIREDIHSVRKFINQVESICNKLELNKKKIKVSITDAEKNKQELVMAFERTNR